MNVYTNTVIPGWSIDIKSNSSYGHVFFMLDSLAFISAGQDTLNGQALKGMLVYDTLTTLMSPQYMQLFVTQGPAKMKHTTDNKKYILIGGMGNGLMTMNSSNLQLDNWAPNPGAAAIYDVEQFGNRMYVGGPFSGVGTQSNKLLAAFETDNDYMLGFDPKFVPGNSYGGLIARDSMIIIGGGFSEALGENRNGLCAFIIDNPKLCLTKPLAQNVACAGSTFKVGYTVLKTPEAGNTFVAQLSDANGYFTNSSIIGSLQSIVSDSIVCTLPKSAAYGTKYRVRVVPLNAVNGVGYVEDNGNDITINSVSAALNTAAVYNLCPGIKMRISCTLQGSAYSYQWLKNNSPIPGATDSFLYADTAAAFRVRVTNNNTGCVDTSTSTTINHYPKTTVTLTPSGVMDICSGDSLSLQTFPTASGLGYMWVQWLKNGSLYYSSRDSVIKVGGAGVWRVCIISAFGCGDTSASLIVNVHPQPVANISPAGNTILCQNDVLKLQTGGGDFYQWLMNGNPVSGATDSSYTTSTGGNFQVVVKTTYNCADTSGYTIVSLKPLPTVSLTLPVDSIELNASPLVLSGGSPAGGYYTGTGVSGGNFNPSLAGIGANVITYIFTDSNGCSNQASRIIIVYFPVGMAQIAQDNVRLYPNPVTDELVLELPALTEESTVVITDMMGKKIKEEKLKEKVQKISLKGLPESTYTITITSSKLVFVAKLLKIGK